MSFKFESSNQSMQQDKSELGTTKNIDRFVSIRNKDTKWVGGGYIMEKGKMRIRSFWRDTPTRSESLSDQVAYLP